jgi:hypothetical protein
MDYTFKNHDGIETCPSFDQTKKTMIEQNFMIKTMTGSKAMMTSFVKPLTTLGVAKILFNRYPEFAKYLVSCSGLDASNESRWCGNCSDCASMYLYMLAFNQSPKKFGFNKNMLGKEMKDLYSVFNGSKIDGFDKSQEARDEQLLAFYLAYKNGAKGYLMDLFKKDLLKEAKSRESKLIKEHLKIGEKSAIPKELQKSIVSIFEEELK